MEASNTVQALMRIENDHVDKGMALKYVEPNWTTREGVPVKVEAPKLVIGTTRALRKWLSPIETIAEKPGELLPEIDELNARIPMEQWETGLDGRPRPPWVRLFVAYLLDLSDASLFTFANSTIGARMAVTALEERIESAKMLYGAGTLVLVRLADRPFHTRFAERRAPHFEVVGFRRFAGGQLCLADNSRLEPAEPIPLGAVMNDENPY